MTKGTSIVVSLVLSLGIILVLSATASPALNQEEAQGKLTYLVKGEAVELGPIPPQQMIQLMEQVFIPSHEMIVKLEKEGKILAGGLFVGQKAGTLIIEAESHDEVDKLLQSLPMWGLVKFKVIPLQSFEDRISVMRKSLEMLKKRS